ncbi:MAG: thiamine-phosphate kinase [Desulfuromonadaceae bacterium]|nr:thiamine-phosphate kinase [Desulfuromonadaceae bacterium]
MKKTPVEKSLNELGEFGLIERLKQHLEHTRNERLVLGIGDDCSAYAMPEGELLLTSTDLLIEGVHFRRDWCNLYDLGRKSAAVNFSDIAAMGGTPLAIFLGIGLPPDLALEEIDHFSRGFLDETAAAGAILSGGDTCRSGQGLFISVTVQGSVPCDQLIRRSGARPGDRLYVSGTLGDSALALLQLSRGQTPPPELAVRHHRPTPRLALGRQLAQRGLATAMIDLSDGLFADLGHILEQSAVGACVQQASLPWSTAAREHTARWPEDFSALLQGGEDYELLFTAAAAHDDALQQLARELDLPLTAIGAITQPSAGLCLVDSDGRTRPVAPRGFNHFFG